MSAPGIRVIRGPGWKQGEADGGEGHVGTIIAAKDDGNADVIWDGGQRMTVKSGSQEIRVLDNAPVGIRHKGVTCDGCHETNIVGMRWKCGECEDYDLCSPCYFNDCHDRGHQFMRYETPVTAPVKMEKRSKCITIQVMGIYPDATVVRGLHWEWQDQDGGPGKDGVVTDLMTPGDNSARSSVRVAWQAGGSNVYRLGLKGKVDLQYKEDHEARGGNCYPQHLPVFDAKNYKQMMDGGQMGTTQDDVIHDGDRVYIDLPADKVQQLRQTGNEIVQVLDRLGVVQGTIPSGEAVVVFGPRKYKVSQSILKKVPKFRLGDRVRVLGDERKVSSLQDGHGGYNRSMRLSLGKVGEVAMIDSDGDVVVQFQDHKWCYNPVCLTLAPGRSLDSVSAGSRMVTHRGGSNSDDSDVGESGLNMVGELLGAMALAAAMQQATQGLEVRVFLKVVIDGDVAKVRQLLGREPKLVEAAEQSVTALHIAANLGHVHIVQLLVEKGAPINLRDKNGETPLTVGMKHDAVAEYLIKKGADVTVANNNGQTASHKAALYGHAHILRLLIAKGADVNAMDKAGDTPLHDAISKSRTTAAEVLIGCSDTDVRRKNKKGFTPLQFAAFKGEASIAELVVRKTQSVVNEQKEDGFTALHIAAINNHTDVMKVLLDKGKATVDMRTQKKQTSLHLAAQEAYMDAVQLLSTHGADMNAKDCDGNRPLHTLLSSHTGAVRGGDLLLLLLVGQAPKVKEEERVRIACFLLRAGADPEARNDQGKTALESCPNVSIAEAVRRFLTANPNLTRPTSAALARQRSLTASDLCRKCINQQATILLVPCGHKAICKTCCGKINSCPQCGSFIRSMHDESGKELKTCRVM
ncbi:E3 ubiquitin-protein ligase MIB1-like [Babylonia areolata]|uniref:E3 ubiquitin-protein ligase MIB1-like n=1 Tax=Babylonia areolata TaxID=304850 RepID=UPI003FD6BD44